MTSTPCVCTVNNTVLGTVLIIGFLKLAKTMLGPWFSAAILCLELCTPSSSPNLTFDFLN